VKIKLYKIRPYYIGILIISLNINLCVNENLQSASYKHIAIATNLILENDGTKTGSAATVCVYNICISVKFPHTSTPFSFRMPLPLV